MFTGIVQATGTILASEARGGDLRLHVDVSRLAAQVDAARLAVGESVAISGTCLTVVSCEQGRMVADVSRETLDLTTLGALQVGDAVNLECALRMGDPLGGHLMLGHVDGIATVVQATPQARSLRVQIEAPESLALLIAPKGSVALDGVSLTVNEVQGRHFGVNLIPHTVEMTTLSAWRPGRRINLEVDPLARYVQRILQG